MTTFAYLRVSKDSQDTKNQKLAILEYSQNKKIVIDHFYEYTISSKNSNKERGIEELLVKLHSGDLLIVAELSRLGRSVGQIIRFIDDLVKRQIHFISIKENIQLQGEQKQNIQSKVMVTMFSLFAEIERDLISLRTKEALAAAKSKGKILGRPKGTYKSKLDSQEDEILRYMKLGVNKANIAKIVGVSKSTLYSFFKKRKLENK